jgi:hypothetical protein
VLALTLAVVFVAGSVNGRSGGSPVSSQPVGILDVYVQDAGDVLLGLQVGPDAGVVVGEVHGEVAEVSKCVSLIVELGPDPSRW